MAAAVAPAAAPPAAGEHGAHEEDIRLLPLKQVTPAKDNPRRSVGDVAELAASIAAVGLIEPLIVTPNGKGYLLVCGSRRYAAAKKAGLTHVPCVVREFDERGRQEAMLVENLQREDLAPLEEASAYKRLVELGLSQRELATRVGRSQGHVSKRLALLELPEEVQAKVDSGGIALADAVELTKLKDEPERLARATRPNQWKTVGELVAGELRARDQERKLEKREQEFESKGIPTMRAPSRWNLPRGVLGLQQGPIAYSGELPLDVKEHAKGNCHAIALLPHGEEVPVCTDRKQHPKVKTPNDEASVGGARAGSAETKAEIKRRQELEEAEKRRKTFVRELVTRKTPLPKGDAIQLFVRTLLGGLDSYTCFEEACGALGVLPDLDLSETSFGRLADGPLHVLDDDVEKDAANRKGACGAQGVATDLQIAGERKADPKIADVCADCRVHLVSGVGDELLVDALAEHAAKSETEALRVGVAVALAYAEDNTTWRGLGFYLETLAARGYEISKAEKAAIERQENGR